MTTQGLYAVAAQALKTSEPWGITNVLTAMYVVASSRDDAQRQAIDELQHRFPGAGWLIQADVVEIPVATVQAIASGG